MYMYMLNKHCQHNAICVCMCVCVCMHVYMCTFKIHITSTMPFIDLYVQHIGDGVIHTSMYVYICMHACVYVCMHACMYVCMHACMHACMYAQFA